MQLKQIKVFQLALAGLSVLLCALSIVLYLTRAEILTQGQIRASKKELPTPAFALNLDAYAAIGEPVLALESNSPRLHLPDLKTMLIYYGRNARPDASMEAPKLHIGIHTVKNATAIDPDAKVYLHYDKNAAPCKYSFSPENKETSLWFTAKLEGNDAKIQVFMRDEEGHIITDKEAPGTFILPDKEALRTVFQGTWELDTWRVDGTLLARQKARWVGVDRFLEKHGGDEFAECLGKHRIDFGEGEDTYSVYVKCNDCLVWAQGRWHFAEPGPATIDNPLLLIKKVEDRVMMLELWDATGKCKVGLNLIRSPESYSPQLIANDFRFVGARTKTQVVFEVNKKRMIVSPNDWFVHTPQGWIKLKNSQDIDDYVNRRIVGPLFVFEDMVRKDDKPILIGTVYNPSRTEVHPIEVAMNTSGPAAVSPQDKTKEEIKVPVATPVASHK